MRRPNNRAALSMGRGKFMSLDRWIAIFFLLFSIVYGYAAWNYKLLPFERNMVFLPNTLPIGLAAIGILLSLILIFKPGSSEEDEDSGAVSLSEFRQYKIGQATALVAAMIVYALALRPIGFIAATSLFLCAGGFILGERKLHIMIPVALTGTLLIWYLVQELLGVFLRPLPLFLGN